MALLLGAAAAAAMPPLFLIFLLLPAFTGLAWMVDGARNGRAAAWVGWWFGAGHFAAGTCWIASAFLVDASTFGWMIPIAIGGLSALLACFFAAATGLCRMVGGHGPGRSLVLAACWATLEWVRSWIFTGFPWNLTATVWTGWDETIQAVSLLGPYGLGLLTVWAASAPAYLSDGKRGKLMLSIAIVLMGAIPAGGAIRLVLAEVAPNDGIRLRLVQPNISQQLKWRDDLRANHVARQVEMSRMLNRQEEAPDVVIWAETAVPYFLAADSIRLRAVTAAVPVGGLLITGAPRYLFADDGGLSAWNSLYALNQGGHIMATYDKFHLVPFGEYVPFRDIVGGLKLTEGRIDFSPGAGPRTLHLPGLPPVSPLICYEVIFPAAVVDVKDRPAWILNITNDGWFGISSGPYQHLAAARLRAVEEGLPVVRVANTGISAVVDAHGRVIAHLDLGTAGVIDAVLPRALATLPLFARFGNKVTFLIIIFFLVVGITLARRHPERIARSNSCAHAG
ncbi:MAG: apolipoprotein N-acyltransferase [Rhodospirillales bacterium]